jgi:hypothetical protein
MFGLSMLGEYVIPRDNRQGAIAALAVFRTFFVILFASGCFTTAATRRITAGAFAVFWTASIASELCVLFLLLVYLSFVGTPREDRFLEVDQTIADFRRSGQSDLRAFIFSDYTGGMFFHSALGAIFGLLLGGLGGLMSLAVIRGLRVVQGRSS